MYLIALTGGIAAGKSTVADLWASLGAVHIDADILAREAVAAGSTGLQRVVDAFGSQVLSAAGELDRAALASLVFDNPEERRKLEAIVHPIVRQLASESIDAQDDDAIVVYSIPLLVESGEHHLNFDRVVSVEAPVEKQIQRLVEARGMTRSEAKARIAAQALPAQRANIADDILNSNQDLALLLQDAMKLWQKIVLAAEAKQGSEA